MVIKMVRTTTPSETKELHISMQLCPNSIDCSQYTSSLVLESISSKPKTYHVSLSLSTQKKKKENPFRHTALLLILSPSLHKQKKKRKNPFSPHGATSFSHSLSLSPSPKKKGEPFATWRDFFPLFCFLVLFFLFLKN